MKRLTIRIENAVSYHEPDTRKPSRVLNSTPETDPIPTPTETTIPEVDDDIVYLQVIDESGRVCLQLPIRNYFEVIGRIDERVVMSKRGNVRPPTYEDLRALVPDPMFPESDII